MQPDAGAEGRAVHEPGALPGGSRRAGAEPARAELSAERRAPPCVANCAAATEALLSGQCDTTRGAALPREGAAQQGRELLSEEEPLLTPSDPLTSSHLPAPEAADECPICTEVYDAHGERSRALLNCDHTVCQCCLAALQERAADPSRVSCPLCRQKTPLPQWEIRRMQEDTVCQLGSTATCPHQPTAPPSPQAAGGLFAALERRLELRLGTVLVCGCFRYPPRLLRWLGGLRLHCRCCYLTVLLFLYLAELSCLLLVFLPVLVLVLLFTLASR
ncbi:uncharacterized protein rnf224 [Amia ocellicauda]|uniref:uncharacterized protein rnf224 n=1 Tax=Amia ocellicauda TaxID=2972642 RepID=UPI003463F0C6